jgi:hypothetical protein
MTQRAVYDLEDLVDTHIEGQFYSEKLRPVSISKRKSYKIEKTLMKRLLRGIQE